MLQNIVFSTITFVICSDFSREVFHFFPKLKITSAVSVWDFFNTTSNLRKVSGFNEIYKVINSWPNPTTFIPFRSELRKNPVFAEKSMVRWISTLFVLTSKEIKASKVPFSLHTNAAFLEKGLTEYLFFCFIFPLCVFFSSSTVRTE